MKEYVVRAAVAEDAPGMASVHVESWRQTYRGIVPDTVLDDPDMPGRRQRWWVRAITEQAEGTTAVVVAEHLGQIVGIVSAGRPRDDDATWPLELFVIYLLEEHHGSGVGARLLHAVVADGPAALWVAQPNPRAQAFYRKHGFVADGASKHEGIPEIRMVRDVRTPTTHLGAAGRRDL
ncbi:GNAT family N-acetyltransferase [Desertihabitans aurantiacus]|uniref:GNAT family N-acetyltransferase n=1 Tax=Desertihabitans aurantiacus TaxID=2282477 RepID=UPI000DF85FB1|nr:GNAT family N-acetyltransferase [Desertihabitans aurantiacus]